MVEVIKRGEYISLKGFKMRRGFTSVELSIVIIAMVSIAGWITHVVHCLMEAKYLLLIAGAIIAPVGVIHGIGLWFGVAW